MGVASQTASPRVRPRDVLIVGAFVVGWSVGRAATDSPSVEAPALPAPVVLQARPVARPVAEPAPVIELRRPMWRKSVRLALAGMAAALVVAAAGLAARPDDARAPLVAPDVAASEHALAVKQAEAARIKLLRHLEARRRRRPPRRGAEAPKAKPKPLAIFVQPSDRAAALATYIEALGTETILRGLDASKADLEQKVLSDPRREHLPGRPRRRHLGQGRRARARDHRVPGAGKRAGQRLLPDLRPPLYVAGRPGVVSAHIYGRARRHQRRSTAPRSSATRAAGKHHGEGDPPDPRAPRRRSSRSR